MSMTHDQWQRVRELFERALEGEPRDLGAWLDREAGDDAVVRAEAASLLRHHSAAGSFLVQPVTESVPQLLTEDLALVPGQRVGSYTIVRELGRGGMGRVYLATDARLGRTVALKALPPRLTRDAVGRERLRREARAAAALTHPGICTVYALEELDGELFIAAEFVDGHPLREEIAGGRRPAPDAVMQTARDLAAALASAHVKGITHRDLKPENVMRAKDGRLKILDFGLALTEDIAGSSATSTGEGPRTPGLRHARMTGPGALAGTPAYMAPEQLNGQPVGARADVFAFGVLLYEYACGTHPFDAPTLLGVAARVLEGDAAPIDSLRPDLPAKLSDIVERCLRKSPPDRFASAVEIAEALSRDDDDRPRRVRVPTWWRAHQVAMIVLYFLASVLAWQVKEWHPGSAGVVFLVLGVAATTGGVFRGHLLFTERLVGSGGAGFSAERRRATPATLIADLLIALALVADGVIMSSARPLAAVLTLALGVGIGLARLVVEPSTTTATFGRTQSSQR
jgi:serine/threonine protein kinase